MKRAAWDIRTEDGALKVYCWNGHEQTWENATRYNEKRYMRRRCRMCAEKYRLDWRRKNGKLPKRARYAELTVEVNRLRAALHRIDGLNDNPAVYNPDIDTVLREVLTQTAEEAAA